VYSGDTKYCPNIIKYCQGATVLIHEATFMGEMSANAEQASHSTDLDACQTGIKIGAWRTILTHFSQRYSKGFYQGGKKQAGEPIKEKSELDLYRKLQTVVAMDHLKSRLAELKTLPKISKKIQKTLNLLSKDLPVK
jgi:ribonuclease Z